MILIGSLAKMCGRSGEESATVLNEEGRYSCLLKPDLSIGEISAWVHIVRSERERRIFALKDSLPVVLLSICN
jgi:hypothetical protein